MGSRCPFLPPMPRTNTALSSHATFIANERLAVKPTRPSSQCLCRTQFAEHLFFPAQCKAFLAALSFFYIVQSKHTHRPSPISCCPSVPCPCQTLLPMCSLFLCSWSFLLSVLIKPRTFFRPLFFSRSRSHSLSLFDPLCPPPTIRLLFLSCSWRAPNFSSPLSDTHCLPPPYSFFFLFSFSHPHPLSIDHS